MDDDIKNPETVLFNGQAIRLAELLKEFEGQQEQISQLKQSSRKAVRRYRRETELKPYQAELIKMQQHLEKTATRMIILF